MNYIKLLARIHGSPVNSKRIQMETQVIHVYVSGETFPQ
ncbi:unnamed protein product [Brassica rapa subsp. narinosa]